MLEEGPKLDDLRIRAVYPRRGDLLPQTSFSVSEGVIRTFCIGCDLLQPENNSCSLLGPRQQAILVAVGVCPGARIDGDAGVMEREGFVATLPQLKLLSRLKKPIILKRADGSNG